MTDRSRLTALAALALGALACAAAPAQAQPRHDDRDRKPGPARRPAPPPAHRGPPPGARRPVVVHRPYSSRPLPRQYLGHNYRIDNWSYYGLPAPRRGLFWVQYGGDFVMVNPSGVVIQIWGN